MKNLHSLMLAAAGCLALASCSQDDDSTTSVSSDLTGTYELTSFVVPNAQDYDGDGDSSTNLVSEGSCQSETWIQFLANGTYKESYSASTSSATGADISCETKVSTGTYVQDGDSVTTTRTSGTGALTVNYTFDANAKTLTRSENNGQYSGFNTVTQVWANLTGNLSLTFTKKSDGTSANDVKNGANSNVGVLGDFNLRSFVVGQAQDLNKDGQTSTDLASETSCYGDSKITFKSDGTYTEVFKYSVMNATNVSLECQTKTTSGTYDRDGNVITTKDTSGSADVTTTYNFNTATNTISRRNNSMEFPGYNSVTSLFFNVTGAVDLAYDKGN